jgi:hypothetical protein
METGDIAEEVARLFPAQVFRATKGVGSFINIFFGNDVATENLI